MKRFAFSYLYLLISLTNASALAQSKPYSPKPGNPERKAILDALRGPVEQELKQMVVFKVDHLKVQVGWAFLRGVPRQPDGRAADYKRTRYREAIEAGAFDDGICALLHKEGEEWRVKKYIIKTTDIPYIK